jgi:hypothetical protein
VAWVGVDVAAQTLGLSSEALRKKLDRNSNLAPDGVVEAVIDGVRGRKFGRLWRVSFSASPRGGRWSRDVHHQGLTQRRGGLGHQHSVP